MPTTPSTSSSLISDTDFERQLKEGLEKETKKRQEAVNRIERKLRDLVSSEEFQELLTQNTKINEPHKQQPKVEAPILEEETKYSAPAKRSPKEDYTKIPSQLDTAFEKEDGNALRSVIVNVGKTWVKKSQKTLLSVPTGKYSLVTIALILVASELDAAAQKKENSKAYDLLDCLSRSGSLAVDHASLHIVVVAANCFMESIMDTVVKGSENPIEVVSNSVWTKVLFQVERGEVILAKTIHKVDLDR